MGFAGQQAPNYGMNNMMLFMRGPDDGQMRVALREGSGIRIAELRERLRTVLPERLIALVHRAARARRALPADQAAARAEQMSFGFEPGDIVSEVMSFGSPTPDRDRSWPARSLGDARQHAERDARRVAQDSGSARRADPADAGLSDRAGHHRPRRRPA